jgi:hypothetical protein
MSEVDIEDNRAEYLKSMMHFEEREKVKVFKFGKDNELKERTKLKQAFNMYGNLFLIDTEQERKISVGRDYEYPTLKKDECLMHEYQRTHYGL